MPRSFTWNDYASAGRERNLSFISSFTPANMSEPTQWRCNICGCEMTKTLRAVMAKPYGCRCQNSQANSIEDYHEVASQYNLIWLGTLRPANSKTPTQWQKSDGTVITATYRDLTYKATPKRLKRLGVYDE